MATQYLHSIYTVSTQYLHSIYTVSTHCAGAGAGDEPGQARGAEGREDQPEWETGALDPGGHQLRHRHLRRRGHHLGQSTNTMLISCIFSSVWQFWHRCINMRISKEEGSRAKFYTEFKIVQHLSTHIWVKTPATISLSLSLMCPGLGGGVHLLLQLDLHWPRLRLLLPQDPHGLCFHPPAYQGRGTQYFHRIRAPTPCRKGLPVFPYYSSTIDVSRIFCQQPVSEGFADKSQLGPFNKEEALQDTFSQLCVYQFEYSEVQSLLLQQHLAVLQIVSCTLSWVAIFRNYNLRIKFYILHNFERY